VILVLLAATLARPAAPSLPTDYEVKAAFLYNFAKFVRWPDDATGGPRFVVAIVGDDPFGAVLDRAFQGKTVLGRPVEIRRTRVFREAVGAQMAFIGSSEHARLAEVLAALKGGSVLTVGDMDSFADGGGMVGFRIKDSTVRFEVNLREVRQARLQMSSQIIRLAQRVIEDGG
jgi:YfiR/HmsC-like